MYQTRMTLPLQHISAHTAWKAIVNPCFGITHIAGGAQLLKAAHGDLSARMESALV